ncbi:ABC-type xenobiotic transporter [Entamoeba marina]
MGAGIAFTPFFISTSLALGLWYGSLIIQGKGLTNSLSGGKILVVFFVVLDSTQALGTISMPLSSIALAKSSAYKIYSIIDRIPEIDAQSISGIKPKECNGCIRFEDVQFRYPSRPTKQILNGLDLDIENGESIALVGSSGCGKSTIIQLIQRLYDPIGGRITLDGNDLRELNVKWLRSQIGVVSQEPILFSGTIKTNIMLGAIEGVTPTEDDVINCSKMANAHDFIMHLPDGYDTLVGEKGMLLSGGQKQRIVIARALIRDPKILLLDEATSALDTQSEKLVQKALDKASKGRTTIVVAHRLSTIRSANKIYVFHQGEIIENGTHKELMELKGTYFSLVSRQSIEEEVDQQTVEEDQEIVEENLKRFQEQDNKDAETISEEFKVTTEEPINIVEMINNEYEKEKEKMKKSNRYVFFRLLFDTIKHQFIITPIGFWGGIIAGSFLPIYTIFFIDLVVELNELNPSVDVTNEEKHSIKINCLKIVAIAVSGLISYYMYIGLFGVAGEKLLGRIRSKFYKAILRQDISWFDRKENMVGSITTRLSSDPTNVKGITGEHIGNVIQMFSTIIFAIAIGFYYDWRIACVSTIASPIIIIIVVVNGKLNTQQSSPATVAYEKSGITTVQAVESIRTIQSLSREDYFKRTFKHDLQKPKKDMFKWAPLLSISNGFKHLSYFGIQAYVFYMMVLISTKTIEKEQTSYTFMNELKGTYSSMQKSMMVMNFAIESISNFGTVLPNVGKAIKAAKKTMNLIDRKPKIDCYSKGSNIISGVVGEIEFKAVCFRYPTRPENSVLKGISFKASQGKTIALVGASGCGKSTTIQLIERFYDVTAGEVLFDGQNIRDLDINFLRNQIGLVSQEPILFAESIMDNIKRGVSDGMSISNEQVYEASKMANAHDFISSLPEGYNTLVGDRGSQLSGGQKQRVAIARALVKNPKVLLLDEATSALDSESEKVVQEALDNASKGRTTIIIAHRLSTIRNADEICVIMKGRVAERGTHEKLLTKKKFYFTLAMQQYENV